MRICVNVKMCYNFLLTYLIKLINFLRKISMLLKISVLLDKIFTSFATNNRVFNSDNEPKDIYINLYVFSSSFLTSFTHPPIYPSTHLPIYLFPHSNFLFFLISFTFSFYFWCYYELGEL
jgi:hypothetical protein